MSIELLELAADVLDDLTHEVFFLGGATIALWLSDPAAPPARPTKDVDVVVEVASRSGFHEFETKLRDHGFDGDQEDGVICRWRHRCTGLVLDAMPSRAEILGFENRWQAAAIPYAVVRTLPSGAQIQVVSPPYLLATKLEAFVSRGQGDLLGSRDFGDVVTLVDGREELSHEILTAPDEVQRYVAQRVGELLAMSRIDDGLAGAVQSDAASQARVDSVIRPRLLELAGG